MPALVLNQTKQRLDRTSLQERLQRETAEIQSAYKTKVITFMVDDGIETISDIDYPARVRFEQ